MNVLKKYSKHKTVLLLILVFGKVNSQSNTQTNNTIYDWYDSKIGRENLDLNNGRIFLNNDNPVTNNSRFFNDTFVYGSIKYNNQNYNNIFLNYDTFEDNIMTKVNGENDKTTIILIKQKIESFSYLNKNFINFDYYDLNKVSNMNGFYEEKMINTTFTLYIKHTKNSVDKIIVDKIFHEFIPKSTYFLKYENKYYNINSKRNIIALFPENKKSINEFYSNNRTIEEFDKTKFLEQLFISLNSQNK